MNCQILGISFDTPEENKAFKEAEGFPFPLLADTDRSVGRAYGTGREPDADKPDYARRESFLLGPDGTIAKTYTVSDVNTHPDQVLADLRELQTGL